MAAPKPCTFHGCPAYSVHRSRCEDHQREAWAKAEGQLPRGAKWRQVRARVLRRSPSCASCGAPAQEVDHLLPTSEGGALLDLKNLQSLCAACHEAKSKLERADAARLRAERRRKKKEPTDWSQVYGAF